MIYMKSENHKIRIRLTRVYSVQSWKCKEGRTRKSEEKCNQEKYQLNMSRQKIDVYVCYCNTNM